MLHSHFNAVLGTGLPRARTINWDNIELPTVDMDGLDLPFTAAEVWEAIKSMPAEKSPGPDGFTGVFYRHCWPVIREDVLAALNHFYNLAGGDFSSLNEALVCLLPKKSPAVSINDYRPISLIHSFGKLVSKILARRLAPLMGELVSGAQSAFIKTRSIHENFLYVRNLAHTLHRRKRPCLLVKLDFARAFDSVAWDYLFELLQRLGFPPRWRDWLATLLSTASTRVLLNGTAGPSIKHRRGLRQGDPLSPFLFDLAIDPLHRLLERATNLGILLPLPAREATIRVSLYADDAIIFVNPDRPELLRMLDVLNLFGQASGLVINPHKCAVAPIRCQDVDLDALLHGFDGVRASFPISYLGLPLALGRLRMVHLQHIIDRAHGKLASWKSNLLNCGGRRALTASVLDALSIFTLTTLRVPKKLLKLLDRIRRRFIWGLEEQDAAGGKCKVRWQLVCSPKDYGGLGILNLEAFSRALRMRWLWQRWQFPDRPWISMEVPCDDLDLEIFAAATRVTIGDGKQASFWLSRWMGQSTLRSQFPALYKYCRRKRRTVADALTEHRWVKDLRQAPRAAILTEFLQLWRLIQSAHIELSEDQPDSISWILAEDGCYSAKSAYRLQFEGQIRSSMPEQVWKVWAPAKCRFFAWLLLQNRLWCADRLMQRRWPNCYFCPLCVRNLETAMHLFFECPYAKLMWMTIATWRNCAALNPRGWLHCHSVEHVWDKITTDTSPTHREGMRSLLILGCWELWKERNRRVFRDKPSNLRYLLNLVQEEAKAWAHAGAKKLRRMIWEPP